MPHTICNLQVALNVNSTFGNFFHHLLSIIYTSLFFAVRFEVIFQRLIKTLQFWKMIHGGYARSYFNLFIIYAVTCDAHK